MNLGTDTARGEQVSLRGVQIVGAERPVTIVVDAGRITAIGENPPPVGRIIDVEGRLTLPGLVDIHIHGAAGRSFEDAADEASIRLILEHLARRGVTSVVASLASSDVATMAEAVRSLNRLRDRPPTGGAQLLGVHLEGPFLAAAQAGAHAPAALRAPEGEAVEILAAAGPAMVTLAPELPGAREAIHSFASSGAVVAAGHSNALGGDLAMAENAGLRHVTHLWSGQSGLVREGPWRVPGLLEESLASSGLTAEVIADGKHLPPVLLEIARRCLPNRLIAVSDATPGAGMPEGWRYRLADVECEVRDGVGVVIGADAFAGSTTTLEGMLAHLHRDLGWPLEEVVPMVASRPSQIMGRDRTKGTLRVGADADVLIVDDDLTPWLTLVRGQEVWPA